MTIDVLDQLPPAKTNCLPQIAAALRAAAVTIIVLDDDPTGTQTVYDIPVLTTWNETAIRQELDEKRALFYILTNSRSLSTEAAYRLGLDIGRNIAAAAEAAQRKVWVISRSDSTLRGHYPTEVDALEKGLEMETAVRFIVPAFFEGGRYTINDVHYVQEREELIPAAETPFAKDHTFGYQYSNLKEWVAEKTGGKVPKESVLSFSIEEFRTAKLITIIDKLNRCKPGATCIVNAADYADLEVFVLALLRSDIQPLCRTAASIVAVLSGKERRGLLDPEEMVGGDQRQGGLIVVGSYVPKTSRQLAHLLAKREVEGMELDIQAVLQKLEEKQQFRDQFTRRINRVLATGRDVVFYTSREVVNFEDPERNVAAAQEISSLLSGVVADLQVKPRFLIAKGGITSSDVATQGLGIKRAMIQGQILAGIPVWKLGPEAKFPGMSFIVFPGNVGSDDALTKAVERLNP